MKINTKFKIGDEVYVPIIGKNRTVPDSYGVTIEKAKIDAIEIFSDTIRYKWGMYETRDEPFVFKTLREAKAYAHIMNKTLFDKNEEFIDNTNL